MKRLEVVGTTQDVSKELSKYPVGDCSYDHRPIDPNNPQDRVEAATVLTLKTGSEVVVNDVDAPEATAISREVRFISHV